mgnify:CR=1 FL=1
MTEFGFTRDETVAVINGSSGAEVCASVAQTSFDAFFLPRHIGLYAGLPIGVPALARSAQSWACTRAVRWMPWRSAARSRAASAPSAPASADTPSRPTRLISIMASTLPPPSARREADTYRQLARVLVEQLHVDARSNVDPFERIPEDDALLERALERALQAREPRAAAGDVDLLDDAIELANATRFGLGSSVWTRDEGELQAAADRIEAGCTFFNTIVASEKARPVMRKGTAKPAE